MIELIDGTLTIESRPIFTDISLRLEPGVMTALVGPSGSGKTSLLHCLGRIQDVSAGRILIGGEDASQWGSGRRRRFWRDQAAFIHQDYGIVPDGTVAYNVSLAGGIFPRRHRAPSARETAALADVGLADRGADKVVQLSGGERQRVGIARALYKGAAYIFADEPTASLDEDNADRVIALLLASRSAGAAVVVATHDARLASRCDQRISLMGGPHR
ncbi:ABC transporter ATP-binding protein [Propioniciclava flava]